MSSGGRRCQLCSYVVVVETLNDKKRPCSCFEERNTRLRGSPAFTPTDQCESYVKKFKEMFLNNNVSSEK